MKLITLRTLSALVVCSCLAASVSAQSETVRFRNGLNDYSGGKNALVKSGAPTGAATTSGAMYVGAAQSANGVHRVLLSFDIATIPQNAVIQSVSLRLTTSAKMDNNVSQVVEVDLMGMASDFTFSTDMTWNSTNADIANQVLSDTSLNPATTTNGAAVVFSSTESFVAYVQSALASGTLNLMVKLPEAIENGSTRHILQMNTGTHQNASYRPELVITYAPQVPEPATVTLVFAAAALGVVCVARRRRVQA